MIMVQAAGFSDIGKVRKTNEDCFLLNEPIGLYVVADGMGGHRGGEVASRLAIETIEAYLLTPPSDGDVAFGASPGDAHAGDVERAFQSFR